MLVINFSKGRLSHESRSSLPVTLSTDGSVVLKMLQQKTKGAPLEAKTETAV